MKIKFSVLWKKSKSPKKQRLYRRNAPLHIKRKFIRAPLSKELKSKYNRRNIGLRKGDKVKIIRGQFRKKIAKIERINTKKEKLFLEGIDIVKKDGTKAHYPINPSNVMITELNLEDKMRQRILDRKKPSKTTKK